jgi:hypothetical protein
VLLASKNVFVTSGTAQLSDSEEFAPHGSVHVNNKIFLRAGDRKGDFVKLNTWTQRFSQIPVDSAVPEPSAALLFAGGGLLVFRAVRGRRPVHS